MKQTKFEFFLVRWTDGRGDENDNHWYDGTGVATYVDNAKQYKTRKGVDKFIASRRGLPLEVVPFLAHSQKGD